MKNVSDPSGDKPKNPTGDRIPILIIDPRAQIRQPLMAALEQIPQADLIGETVELDEGLQMVETKLPAIVFLNLHPTVSRALALAEDMTREIPDLALFVVGEAGDSDLVIRAMRAGADEFITLPIKDEEIQQAIWRLQQRSTRESKDLKRGRTICCFGIKGGIGVTTMAMNLAAGIVHNSDRSAAIVDLCHQSGGVSTFFDLTFNYTILDVIENFQRLDRDFLQGTITRHSSGIHILPAPRHVEESDSMEPDQIRSILLTMRSMYDYVVIDTMKSFSDVNLSVFDFADMICMLTEMNIPSLRVTRQALDVFERLGYSQEKVKLIVNRFQESKDFSLDEVTQSLSYPIYWKIPNEYVTVNKAINMGQPIPEVSAKSQITRSYLDLAATLFEFEGDGKAGRRRGRLRNLFSK